MEIWFLVSITELSKGSVVALHHNIVVVWVVERLVHGPEAKDLLEIVEVHPENTIIAASIETDLVSKLIGPKRRLVTPVTVPLTTTPWVSKLDESDCVSIDIEYLSSGKKGVGMAWHNTLLLSQGLIISV